MNAIEVAAVVHRYGERRALDDVSFDVRSGEIFGLLGPNGGGKTTLFRILTTLMAPTGGAARVLGHDCVQDARAVRAKLGVVFQSPSLDPKLRVRENLWYHGALYGLHGRDVRARTADRLARVGLTERALDKVEDLSGGLRRRVELAKGMLHDPDVMILDEPSTGLDPGARRDLWEYLGSLRERDGVTSLVTTHLMEEAERCDRLAILDEGRLVALGTPDELRARIGGAIVTLGAPDSEALQRALLDRFKIPSTLVDDTLRFEHEDAQALLPKLFAAFGAKITTVSVGRPTLEDVFIQATGHKFWSADA